MVKLSYVTDNACGSVHNTLQGVSDRLCGSSEYGVALVNTGGHERMDKCTWYRAIYLHYPYFREDASSVLKDNTVSSPSHTAVHCDLLIYYNVVRKIS